MIGKVIAGMISIVFITFLVLMIALFFLQETIKSEMNQLNYHMTEVVATSGILSQSLWDTFQDEVSRYGDYDITLKLEREIKPGIYDIYFDPEDILDLPLSIGDRFTIYLEDRNMTLFKKLTGASVLGYQTDVSNTQGIRSVKTGIISKNAKDMVKGYDVIVAIDQFKTQAEVAIYVVTKQSETGKYYGSAAHEAVDITNLEYGDDPDEQSSTGMNYIFEAGDFLRTEEYDNNETLKLIHYIQQ